MADVTAVPAVIDAAYVQRVIDVLDVLLLKAAQAVARDRALSEEFSFYMKAVYSPAEYVSQVKDWQARIQRIAAQPGKPATRVLHLISASSACVFVSAERNLSPLFGVPLQAVQPYYLKLERHQPDGVNPTPWVLGFSSFFRSGRPPPDLCRQ